VGSTAQGAQQMTDTRLTAVVKNQAFTLGADLVGVGNIERWDKCPALMSPKGIMPTARAVLVCAIHHTDGMIEMGGESSPHDQGSYLFQMLMNDHLDVISYTMGRFLEDAGYRAVPITASNIWRYRPYKDLTATFAPDMSHIYASVAAGLSEMGYNGLAMTPEYGARNRFVSIITDAPLEPSPLLPGNTLCDRCNMCVKMCPTLATSAEVVGETALEIEDKRYRFANKNLWRCAWAEHFGLSVDLPVPEQVTEENILEMVNTHGLRGGTMGYCLKYCLPKARRSWNKEYSSAPIRRKDSIPAAPEPERGVQERLLAQAMTWGADEVVVEAAADWEARGVNLKALLPDVQSIVLFAVDRPPVTPKSGARHQTEFGYAMGYIGRKCAFFTASALEKLGYSGAPYMVASVQAEPGRKACEQVKDYAAILFKDRQNTFPCFTLTSARLTPVRRQTVYGPLAPQVDRTAMVKRLALELGADVVGVSSAARLSEIAAQLRPVFDGELILHAKETGRLWLSAGADVTEDHRKVQAPDDHLEGAKSVIVLGIRMPRESVERLAKAPAEAIGPYAFALHQSHRQLRLGVTSLVKVLRGWGVRCAVTDDLCGTGSLAANPRGQHPSAFSNRFAAVAAGLGTLTRGGFVRNPQYGTNLRYVAIVIDAELGEDELADLKGLRRECEAGCRRCLGACSIEAFKRPVSVTIGRRKLSFTPVEQCRCDWALRYGLVQEEGVKYTGSQSSVPVPEQVTAAALAEGMKQQDKVLKIRPCVAEMCLLACPYTRPQE
jgi:epoxyqueuosine reductase QueG